MACTSDSPAWPDGLAAELEAELLRMAEEDPGLPVRILDFSDASLPGARLLADARFMEPASMRLVAESVRAWRQMKPGEFEELAGRL